MGKKKKYVCEFRLRCVELVLKGEGSVRSVSKENGIEHSIPSVLGKQDLSNVQSHHLKTIPKDKRHQSKVDYDALMKRL